MLFSLSVFSSSLECLWCSFPALREWYSYIDKNSECRRMGSSLWLMAAIGGVETLAVIKFIWQDPNMVRAHHIIFSCIFALTVIPSPPLFSLTTQLRNPLSCPVTFVTGQRLLKQSFPDSASRLCTLGSATRPSSRPLRLELATGVVLRVQLHDR